MKFRYIIFCILVTRISGLIFKVSIYDVINVRIETNTLKKHIIKQIIYNNFKDAQKINHLQIKFSLFTHTHTSYDHMMTWALLIKYKYFKVNR